MYRYRHISGWMITDEKFESVQMAHRLIFSFLGKKIIIKVLFLEFFALKYELFCVWGTYICLCIIEILYICNFKFILSLSLDENLRKETICNCRLKLEESSINSDPITQLCFVLQIQLKLHAGPLTSFIFFLVQNGLARLLFLACNVFSL